MTNKNHIVNTNKKTDSSEWEKEFDKEFVTKDGVPCGYADWQDYFLSIKYFIASQITNAHAEGVRDTLKNVGMLRQWLNEDRIKDVDRFVTNEELEHWLKDDMKEKE